MKGKKMKRASRKWVWAIGIVVLVVLSCVLYVSTTPINLGPTNITLITDKKIYNKGENINIIFNPGNEDVYIQKNVFNGSILLSTEFEVYRLQNNEWIMLRLDTYCGNVMSCSEYGLISLPCPAPPQPECNKIANKITWVWNQKVWEYVTKTCGNTTYTSEELKQVDAGTYKIRVNYYNSNYCNDTQKYVETQFEIR